MSIKIPSHVLNAVKKYGMAGYRVLFTPVANDKYETFTNDQLKALSDRRTLSKLLFHRAYFEEESNPDIGFYKMADGRIGTLFSVVPPPYLSKSVEATIVNILGLIVKDDTVVHINTFAGRNIANDLKEYKECHQPAHLNIKNPELVRDFTENRVKYYDKWTQDSMMGRDANLRARTFTHTVSVLFPPDATDYEIKEQTAQIYGVLKDIGGKKMPAGEFIPLVREILDPEAKAWNFSNDRITKLNKQMSKSAKIQLSPNSGLITLGEKGTWKAKVLTTDKFPHEVSLFEYQNAFFDALGNDYQIHLPCPFLLSLVVKYTNVEERRKSVISKAKWNIGQLSGLGLVVEKKMPHIKTRRQESEAVIQLIDEMGEIPLDAMLSITVFEQNEDRLNQYVGAFKKSFEGVKGRWIWKEETYSQIAFQIMMMSINMQYSEPIHDTISKMDINFKSNNAQIAPLIGDFKGNGGKPVHAYFGPTGQFIGLDYFASKLNYNVIIFGPMGSGKSFFANDFIMSGHAAGWDIRLIDFGRSYERLAKDIGGQFIEFPRDNDKCLNFFTYMNTKMTGGKLVIHEDEFDTLVPIVGLMLGMNLRNIYKSEDSTSDKLMMIQASRFIIKAIERAFEVEKHNAGMKEVREALIEIKNDMIEGAYNKDSVPVDSIGLLEKMIIGVENFSIPGAPYFKYFNGVNNINLDSGFVITELDDIADSPIMPVIAMLVLQRMAQEAFVDYLKNPNKARVVGLDEAWRVIKSLLFASFFEDFARRIRKYKGITLIMTQTISEFFENSSSEAIFETAAWKVFMPQEAESIDKARKNGNVAMSDFECELLKSIKSKKPHFNEAIIKHSGMLFKVLLKVTPDDYWLFTTDPKDRAVIHNVIKEKEMSMRDAIFYLARKSEGIKEEEIYYLLGQRNVLDVNKVNWNDIMYQAIEKDIIPITTQSIYQINKDNTRSINSIEMFMNLKENKDTSEILYPRNMFLMQAKKQGLYFEIAKKFFNRALRIMQRDKYENIYAMNLDIYEIQDTKFTEYILKALRDIGDLKNRIVFEIKLDYDVKENYDTLIAFSKELNKINVKLAFDNASLSQIDVHSVVEIHPAYLKIDISQLEDIKDSGKSNSLKQLFYLYQNSWGVKIIITKIETEEQFELLKEYEIDYVQGFYFQKPYLV